jgi:RimJ/RimL family protein N-acetyltransferase
MGILKTVYSDPKRYVEWASGKIGIAAFRSDARAIGLERDGLLIAVAVYDTFSPGSCAMHIASDGSGRWLNKDFLFRMFAYPFIQCGFRRVTGLIAASNTASLRFARHIGFQDEGVLREEAPDGDVIVLGMLRRECKWISEG